MRQGLPYGRLSLKKLCLLPRAHNAAAGTGELTFLVGKQIITTFLINPPIKNVEFFKTSPLGLLLLYKY